MNVHRIVSAALFGAIATHAAAQVTLVEFRWVSMGSGAATATGVCLRDECPPVETCTPSPIESYTLNGASMSTQSVTALGGRVCGFICSNHGGAASASANASVLVNINDPDVSGDFVRWTFSHHMGIGAGASLDFAGSCGGGTRAAADGNATQSWTIVFNLDGPTLVNLNYSHGVQAAGVGFASSMWTIASPALTFFSEAINTQNGPVMIGTTLEQVLPAGQYRLDLNASTTGSPFAPLGGTVDAIAIADASCILTFRAQGGCACPADFNCSGGVNSQDFFDFLGAFFGQLPSADFNADGVVNSQDFFDFLVAFFAPC